MIEAVLGKLTAKDRWNSRLISSRWGDVVREYGGSVVVSVDPDTLLSRSPSFLQQQYPKTRFTLKLANSLGFTEIADSLLAATVAKARIKLCSHTLRSLTSTTLAVTRSQSFALQGDKLSNCDLEVTLTTKHDVQPPSHFVQVCKDVKTIAAAAHILQKRDVTVRIRLQAVLASAITPMLVNKLGPFLLSIDSHQVLDLSAELLQVSDFTTKAAACFSQAALTHLGDSSSPIQSLSLSDHSIPGLEACKGLPLGHSISAIASLQHLTKLHLSIEGRTDFDPLTQLTSLEDLALQALSRHASACQVLHSNRHSLQHVILSSRGWDSATFEALQSLPNLDSVTIKVVFLTDVDAATLSSLHRPSSLQIMLRNCNRMHPHEFHTLTSGIASLTHLELWELDQACFAQLQSVQSLSGLTLVRPSLGVTGQGFKSQPRLETLRLISCFGMNDEGLRELVAGAPALKILMIQQEMHYACPAELNESDTVTKHGLVSLAEAAELMYVDLQGVKLTKGGQKLLESSICAQQKAGNMRSAIALVLPKFSRRYGESVFSCECLHYPAFVPCSYPAFVPCRSSTIHCGSVGKEVQLKGVLSALKKQQVLRT